MREGLDHKRIGGVLIDGLVSGQLNLKLRVHSRVGLCIRDGKLG
jgi:hypothetical protein